MSRTATDVAREIIEEGVPCDEAFEEFVSRVEAEGLRFCPLAEELILGACPPEEEPPPPEEFPTVPPEEPPPEENFACEALANSLAERDQRGEIKLSAEGLILVRAGLTGRGAGAAANSAAERDQRGEIQLTDDELALVRCLLGVTEEVTPVPPLVVPPLILTPRQQAEASPQSWFGVFAAYGKPVVQFIKDASFSAAYSAATVYFPLGVNDMVILQTVNPEFHLTIRDTGEFWAHYDGPEQGYQSIS